ncbi:LysM peptidoglycan-binding domain-containing protein [Flavobacterium sediminilitoris]|uniref:LysM peptidoglycan-binding domain-containing protein n=1 Tax=Flavobacterium sediminilitoris TaxID=2024526 RepID=A0ABY4HJ88_9FLAO|nr:MULTISPECIES: LysM peptidoglycan-binding domain-containing protein [Flavobacterium]UOX32785.1 LysM peptidoglycan-binding domain-containing protein [Flavobacterium sediminilitoris]
MKYILILLACSNLLFAQEIKTNNYTIQPKETLYSISKKFNVSVDEIKKINTDLTDNSLKIGQVILIPEKLQKKQSKLNSNKNEHIVQSQETLFGIARNYNVSVQDLEDINEEVLKEGLRTGQKIKIPNKKKTLDGKPRIITNETVFHKVILGETKYSISKTYKISIEQLEIQNPEIINGLVEGTILAINSSGIKPKNEREELMVALAEKQAIIEKSKAQNSKIEDLEDKLIVQKEMNQKIIKLNSLDVDLKEIDESKGNSVEKLKLILESNKNVQDILSSKLDSLVVNMYNDLDNLKKSNIDDVDTYKKLQKESQANRIETNKMIVQLKRDLNESRKNYVDLMNKVQRVNVQQEQELKRRNKSVKQAEAEREAELEQIRKIQELHANSDKTNESLFFKMERLEKEKEYEITKRIEKATFYSASAREYDDRLALQKLIRYQNKIRQDKKIIEVVEEPMLLEDIRMEIKKSNFNKDRVPAMETITNLKDEENGFYLVLKITQDTEERDRFTRALSDEGDLKTSFFYDINTFSYYIYSQKFKTFEETLYTIKKKESLPLYAQTTIVELKLE